MNLTVLALGPGRRRPRKLADCRATLQRLQPAVLSGHGGCVNRLAWNPSGTTLASGSDDQTVILWDYPTGKQRLRLQTGHSNNIFGVRQFHGAEDVLLTCAADGNVEIITNIYGRPTIMNKPCHRARVKGVDVVPGSPFVGYSAGEDGAVRLHDRRERHMCSEGDRDCDNTLIQVDDTAGELHAVSVHPLQHHQLAVAASDECVRVFDTRRPALAAVSFRPPQLRRGAYPTHVAFSATGRELVATFGTDSPYVIDWERAAGVAVLDRPERAQAAASAPPFVCMEPSAPAPPTAAEIGSRAAATHKEAGNAAFRQGRYCLAVSHYSRALAAAESAPLYCNRAAALLRRAWTGDAWAALGDCDEAIRRDPSYAKAFYRRCLALAALPRGHTVAQQQADVFEEHWPSDYPALRRQLDQILPQVPSASSSSDSASDSSSESAGEEGEEGEEAERELRVTHPSFFHRYCGSTNLRTDIKEAAFFGDSFVVAGGDHGKIHFWHRRSGAHLLALHADAHIVNCVQPHPFDAALASSGIDATVKLWQPVADAETPVSERPGENWSDVRRLSELEEDHQRQLAMVPAEPRRVQRRRARRGEGGGGISEAQLQMLMQQVGVDNLEDLLAFIRAQQGEVEEEEEEL